MRKEDDNEEEEDLEEDVDDNVEEVYEKEFDGPGKFPFLFLEYKLLDGNQMATFYNDSDPTIGFDFSPSEKLTSDLTIRSIQAKPTPVHQ
ncbi:hypothetical protein BY996DRAFT_6463046 [Phakopsora pachyrhizi]|nr:hypothetical protein BY996DRAFT_6463046 [Phakopsora pachyrhizi]